MPTRLLPFLLGALLLASAPSASAQEPDSDPRLQQARELFEQGAAHHADGRYLLAAQAFEQAHALMVEANHPRAGMILFNIGASLEQIPGREAEARDAYQRFLTEAPGDDPAVQDQIARVQDRIRELNARIGEGGTGAVSPEESGGISPAGPIVMGVGGAAIIAGIIMGAIALTQDADQAGRCPTRMNCLEELMPEVEQTRTLAAVGDGFWIGGVVVAAAGLVLILVLRDDPERGDVAIEAVGATGGGGLRVRGSF